MPDDGALPLRMLRLGLKAASRVLPMVFLDDELIGDYQTLRQLEEDGQLDKSVVVGSARVYRCDCVYGVTV